MIFTKKKLSAYVDPQYTDLMEEARARFNAAAAAEDDQRERSMADLRFCDPEQQWHESDKTQRESEGRPCLVIDRLGPFVHQIVNDERQSRPQPQVNPVGDGATKDTAEVLQGMIRHIAYMSNGDIAVDTAFESMVRCGFGYFRVQTEFRNDETFEQDIVIKRIANAFTVYLDPSFTEPDGSDAQWGFIASYLTRSAFKAEYPNSKMAGLEKGEWKSIGDEAPEWVTKDGAGCFVLEYFKKVFKPVEIAQLEDGSVVPADKIPKGKKPVDTRTVLSPQVMWFKLSPLEVLDKTEWAGKYIPIIPVLGTELIIDGVRTWSGLIRSAKDAARAYNYWKSAQAETIALAPRAPWLGPKGFMGNMKNIWAMANRRSLTTLEYEPYDSQGRAIQPPQRQFSEPPIQAITVAMNGAIDDLKGTTGMYDPTIGNREGDQSGVAIKQLQRQGQSGNYHYQDNLARSIRHLGRILIDLIPKIYDTKRVVKIIRPDDSVDMVTLNAPDPTGEVGKDGLPRIYKPGVGTYDVTISVGPSYQTKRQENLALLESLLQGPLGKLLATVAPDLVASELDFAIAPQLVERLKKTLPPQLQDQPKGGPAPLPPQAQQQMQQMQQMIQNLTDALKKETEIASGKQMDVDKELRIAAMNNQTKVLVAEIAAKSKVDVTAFQGELDHMQSLMDTWMQGSPTQAQPDPTIQADPTQSPASPSMPQPSAPIPGQPGALAPPTPPGDPYAAPQGGPLQPNA